MVSTISRSLGGMSSLLFLFDEPLSNLDAQLRAEMRMEIKQLHQRLGSTIVYVHDQIEAMTLATRIAVMRQGVVQQFADPETVHNPSRQSFRAQFMGAPPMNTLSARLETTPGGVVTVIGQGAEVIRFPVPAGAEGWIGREVVLGIRPECIAEPTRRFSDVPDAVLPMR
jgi:multiple sugar transport system ATP-binding protein